MKVWTEILIPREVEDILLVPGGRGARKVLCLEQEMLNILKESAKEASACMMIGNGSAVLAQTGLLYRRRIADYPGGRYGSVGEYIGMDIHANMECLISPREACI